MWQRPVACHASYLDGVEMLEVLEEELLETVEKAASTKQSSLLPVRTVS